MLAEKLKLTEFHRYYTKFESTKDKFQKADPNLEKA